MTPEERATIRRLQQTDPDDWSIDDATEGWRIIQETIGSAWRIAEERIRAIDWQAAADALENREPTE